MKCVKEKIIGISLILVAVILAVAGYFVLPDTLAVQIGLDGVPSNFLPKIPALLIPLLVTAVFSCLYMKSKGEGKTKNLLLSLLGIGIDIIMFVMNYAG